MSHDTNTTGVVTLAGAGPGDPDLLTVGAARALSRADVVVYDHLVAPEVLELAPPHALRIPVGKHPFGEQVAQQTINSILVREGSLGRNVVRLKGGDPFIFGRGAEEIEALHAAGIPFRVIPGVSSLNGVLGPAGFSLTSRGRNHGFTVVSGAGSTSADEIRRWAAAPGPLVIFMGVHRAAEISRELAAGGLDPATPVALVARGGTPQELVVETTLAGLPVEAADPRALTPALIVVGIARERAFAGRPLDGRVAVLPGRLDSPVADALRALGARVARQAAEGAPAHPLARNTHLGEPQARPEI
ncbi:MAG: uroporphyrinogen-III C-methyltransferase [Planctomycetes bacterium]|nr:uroporphyrinogen-III C-methyltransferase [Planctomycetota bacterium]